MNLYSALEIMWDQGLQNRDIIFAILLPTMLLVFSILHLDLFY
jgi:hypothetical protein